MRPGVVAFELEVVVLVVEDALHLGVEHHARQWTWLAAELLMHLVHMVEVDVRVAEGVDKLPWLQACDVSHHHAQQRVARDVERHAQEQVGAALIELQTQFAVGDIELEDGVAWRQLHRGDLSHIPRAHHDAARVGGVLYLVNHLANLVDMAPVIVGP